MRSSPHDGTSRWVAAEEGVSDSAARAKASAMVVVFFKAPPSDFGQLKHYCQLLTISSVSLASA